MAIKNINYYNEKNINRENIISNFLQILLIIYFFIVPIEFYLNAIFFFGSSVKYLGALIILISFLVILINKNFTFQNNILGILFWLIMEIISLTWASKYSNIYLSSYINVTIFFIVITSIRFNKSQINSFIFSSLIGSSFAACILVFFGKSYLDISDRESITIAGYQLGPNGAAAFLATGISISLYYLFTSKKKTIFASLLFLQLTALFFTGSRGGLVTTIVVLFFCILFYIKKQNYDKFNKIKIILIILVIIFITFLITNNLSLQLKERLFNIDSYKIENERIIIWHALISNMDKNIIFGFGPGGVIDRSIEYFGIGLGSHNTFLWIFIETGLIGFLAFMSSILKTVKCSIKNKNLLAICLLISAITPALFLDALGFRWFWNGIILASLLLNNEYNTTIFNKTKLYKNEGIK
ncbi:MAG: O-antigen ligase family protein [Saccharofermentanales bacterium]